jgi:hypothetical protein
LELENLKKVKKTHIIDIAVCDLIKRYRENKDKTVEELLEKLREY